MNTQFTTKEKALRDREYWFKQGYAVGMLYPGVGDEFYTIHVDLSYKGGCDVRLREKEHQIQ